MELSIRQKAFNEKVIKAYDVRGIYPEELDHNTIELIAEGFAEYIKENSSGKTCLVGGDVRWSSKEIVDLVISKLIERGTDVIDIGQVTTPMFVFSLNKSKVAGGIMVTASHNPIKYNGLKLYRNNEALSNKDGLNKIREIVANGIPKYSGARGSIRKENFLEEYTNFLSRDLKIKNKVSAVFDFGGGAVGPVFKNIIKKISNVEAELILPDPDSSLLKRNPDPLSQEAQKIARGIILKKKAEVGFIYDPDGDRVIVLDENGKEVRGDAILWLLANKMVQVGESVVYDLRCSRAIAEDLEVNSIKVHRSRVGHSFIKEAMRLEDAVLGGELSGHFYFKNFFFSDSALFATFRILEIISSSKEKFSVLLAPFYRYIHSGEINFTIESKDEIIPALEEKYADAERDYLDGATFKYPDWWFNVRFSNTENLLRLVFETKDQKSFDLKKGELFSLLALKGAKSA